MKLVELEMEGAGLPVFADLRSASPESALPLVVISPGFLGYKGWGFFPWLSEKLALAGFHVMTITFSHSGTDRRTGMISRPGEFASNSVSSEREDLENTVRFALSSDFPFPLPDGRRIALLGHSRGGAVSILVASVFREVASLVTWSTLARLDRYTDRRKEDWEATGRLEFHDPRASGVLWLDYSYYRDIAGNPRRYDIPRVAAGLAIPHLVVHGERDAAVTMQELELLLEREPLGERKVEILKGCGHAFGVRHPMVRPTESLIRAAGITERWLLRTLNLEKDREE